MSIDRETNADSHIKQSNLKSDYHGYTDYELHCTNAVLWRWCLDRDMHFKKMIVQINDNPAEIKFSTYEDGNANPPIHDIRKVLGHELFHAMGIDHNSSSDSIVYYQYVFGRDDGYTASTIDKNNLGARYT